MSKKNTLGLCKGVWKTMRMKGILISKWHWTRSDADKVSRREVLDMTRYINEAMFRGEVGAKLAINIANGVRLQRVNEDKDNHSTSEGASSPFAIFHFIFLLLFLLHRSK